MNTEIKKVFLLYECDAWLSHDSHVLMGVFTTEEQLEIGCNNLIHQRIEDNFDAEGYDDGWSKSEMQEDFAHQMLKELLENRQTQTYEINYIIKDVEPNKVNEI